MSKSPDAFRTISEVADWLGVQAHVLRFWESKFTQVKPVKRAGGRRYYRPSDMLLLGGIRQLLHDDGMTIKGAQKILREQGIAHVSSLSRPLDSDFAEVAVDATVVPFIAPSAAAPVNEPEPAPELKALEPVETDMSLEAEPADEVADVEDPPEPLEPVDQATLFDESPEAEEAPEGAETAESLFPAADTDSDDGALVPAEDELVADAEADEAPESVAEPEPELPAFIRSAATQAPSAPEAPVSPRARVVDAPDPPSESEIAVSPGLLSRIAQIYALDGAEARRLAPVAGQLADWLDRSGTRRVS